MSPLRAAVPFAEGLGSLANPDPRCILSGDGTQIQAATDAIEGDLVVNSDGEPQQARYDPDAPLSRKDPTKDANPSYNRVHGQVSQPGIEQERVIVVWGRADELGEARTFEALMEYLKLKVPNFRHYCYDMAVQGASINRSYGRGLHPAVKVPRNKKGEPASAIIETPTVTGHSGRGYTLEVFGLDGVIGIKAIANGEELFVPLLPKAVREPRIGCVQGFYEIPESQVVHPDLHGRPVMIRLDGTTKDGRHRPQYIRWINEHTEKGRATLGLREGTESEHSTIKRMLPWKRARSYGDFNNTLDMAGYYFVRNLKAALAHKRRTGHMPMQIHRPPGQPETAAA